MRATGVRHGHRSHALGGTAACLAALVGLAGCSADDRSGVGAEPASSSGVMTPAPSATSTATTTATSGSPSSTATAPAADAPPPVAQLETVGLQVEPLADVPQATAMAWRPDDPALYVTSQGGKVSRLVAGAPPAVVLDLSATVTELLQGSERGLLGIAFDPRDGRMFLDDTDRGDDTHVVSYAVGADGMVDASSAREVLFQEQPGLGHKGGTLVFDADGTLLVGFEGSKQRFNPPPGLTLTPPVYEWTHDVGTAAIGGYVYRGTEIPALRGELYALTLNKGVFRMAGR